jgi:CMP-N,N'-diacetyllegionaminic acid synthase
MDKIAVIILARKNSKRIPEKNFKNFNGKPLIHWTLVDACQLGHPVYFYSDCEKMRYYASMLNHDYGYNINIREKPEKYAQDKHNTGEELRQYNKEIKADIIVNLQVTSPIRKVKLLKQWINKFKSSKFSCGMSIYKLPDKYFYFGGQPVNFDYTQRGYNGCEKYRVYVENGGFYIFKKEMLEKKHFIQPPCQMFVDIAGVDLDNIWQWEGAEALHRRISNED